jgi:PAS domain S-box-containing protein
MEIRRFRNEVKSAATRAEQVTGKLHNRSTPEHKEAVQELMVLVEQLHVAEEELRVQVAELEETQTLLEIQRKKYADLFNFAPDAYLVTDLDGKIIEANDAAASMLNVPLKHLHRKALVTYVADKSRQAFRQRMNELGEHAGKDWHVKFQPRLSDSFTGSVRMGLVWGLNGLEGFRWIIRDITHTPRIDVG